ncbi:hypothetical protein PA14OR_1120 [Pseudomonas aeruginosa]|uniref:Uncharacterized protein n=3 Tax=Pseudomonas aeruginosa TaxID=287 RepID=A0A0H2ZFC8_PSEAB|nr:hypothetical protein PA14_13970 [Pseudomonas aeruginosa UCBPP-PA14]SCM60985.1 hypothetical protein PA14OR_1120 [Pseudomonas aeruginosa]
MTDGGGGLTLIASELAIHAVGLQSITAGSRSLRLTLIPVIRRSRCPSFPMKQMTFADAEYAGKRKQRRVCNGGMAAARCSRRLKTQK